MLRAGVADHQPRGDRCLRERFTDAARRDDPIRPHLEQDVAARTLDGRVECSSTGERLGACFDYQLGVRQMLPPERCAEPDRAEPVRVAEINPRNDDARRQGACSLRMIWTACDSLRPVLTRIGCSRSNAATRCMNIAATVRASFAVASPLTTFHAAIIASSSASTHW